jgi:hypothetical protein
MSYQSHWKRNLILSLIVIIIVVVGVVASLSMQSPRVYTITIFNDQETVNAGGYNPHPFTIPSGASDISVSGAFTAQGGSDNDIKMYIIDYANFVNYTNNNDFSYLYYSGQLHAAWGLNVYLSSSGDYYLVLDNKFSISYQKLVNIQMNATYTK